MMSSGNNFMNKGDKYETIKIQTKPNNRLY